MLWLLAARYSSVVDTMVSNGHKFNHGMVIIHELASKWQLIVSGIASLNTTEVYNPVDDTWTPSTPMVKSRSAAGCCAIPESGHVYAIGEFP